MKVFRPKWLPASLPGLAVGVRPTAAGRQTFALLLREPGWGHRVVAHVKDLPLTEVREAARALAREARWYRRGYPRRGRPRLIQIGALQSPCHCGDCERVAIGRLLAPLAPEQDPLLQARTARLERVARLRGYAEWVAAEGS